MSDFDDKDLDTELDDPMKKEGTLDPELIDGAILEEGALEEALDDEALDDEEEEFGDVDEM